MKLTLASTSKFKNEIFDKVKLTHYSMKPTCEEISSKTNPYEYVMELSLNKAKSILEKSKTDIIIGLDTIVVINDKIIEKPKSTEEAKQNLRDSSNNKASIITGIAIINKETNQVINTYQESIVYFNEISESDINFYIENEPDYLYASGFIVETIASNFINKIEGSYYNILGAPVEKIYDILKTEFKLDLYSINNK